MPDHEWNDLPLLLCERHKLRRKLARQVSVERHKACCPGAIEDREKQQWIFGRFSERFCSLDELTRPFNGRLGLRRRIAFYVHESVNECDLQLDLFATHDRRAGQGRNLVKGPRKLLSGFDQCRSRQRPLPGFTPKGCGFLHKAGVGPMSRQQLRLALRGFREFALDGFGDAGMQCASWLAQQRPVSRVLHEGMLEQISRLRGHAPSEQQTSRDETVQRRSQLRLRLAYHGGEQGMRKLAADYRRDLC